MSISYIDVEYSIDVLSTCAINMYLISFNIFTFDSYMAANINYRLMNIGKQLLRSLSKTWSEFLTKLFPAQLAIQLKVANIGNTYTKIEDSTCLKLKILTS